MQNNVNYLFRRWILKLIMLLPIFFIYKYLRIDKRTLKEIDLDIRVLSENTGYILEKDEIVVLKIKGNIEILSLKCTHLGCTIKYYNGTFKCPCHGSEFDSNGNPLKGPATKPLIKYNYYIKNNKIYISLT